MRDFCLEVLRLLQRNKMEFYWNEFAWTWEKDTTVASWFVSINLGLKWQHVDALDTNKMIIMNLSIRFFAWYLVVDISKSVNCKKQPKIHHYVLCVSVSTVFVISLSCSIVRSCRHRRRRYPHRLWYILYTRFVLLDNCSISCTLETRTMPYERALILCVQFAVTAFSSVHGGTEIKSQQRLPRMCVFVFFFFYLWNRNRVESYLRDALCLILKYAWSNIPVSMSKANTYYIL